MNLVNDLEDQEPKEQTSLLPLSWIEPNTPNSLNFVTFIGIV